MGCWPRAAASRRSATACSPSSSRCWCSVSRFRRTAARYGLTCSPSGGVRGLPGVVRLRRRYLGQAPPVVHPVARVNAGLLWRSLALLFTTSVLPFPTAVVGSAFRLADHAGESAALACYADVGVTTATTWLMLLHFLSRAPGLLEDKAHTAFFARERNGAVAGITLYVISGLCAAWFPVAGLVIACALPVFYGITSAGLRPPGF